MKHLIHLALDDDGTVLAQFLRSEDCAAFCEHGIKYTHVPFNTNNRDGAPVPPVGSKHVA